MAKSKNHTNHNKSVKNHKNGIKAAPALHKFRSVRGGWLPVLVNTRHVRKANEVAAKKARNERLAAFRKTVAKK